jgi:hypothetical protein
MERSHLSDLMGNVQKMHNDLERSGENDRRRLENQLQMLEGQTYVFRTAVELVKVNRLLLQTRFEDASVARTRLSSAYFLAEGHRTQGTPRPTRQSCTHSYFHSSIVVGC